MRQADSNPFSHIFSPQPWDSPSRSHDAQSQDVNETQTPPVLNVIDSLESTPATVATPAPGRPRSHRVKQGSGQKLRLLCREEWDEHKVCDEDPPAFLHYLIEWCAMLSGKEVLRDTQPNLVLKPSDYWKLFLRAEVERLVQEELGSTTLNHIVVNVANSGRSARKFVKRFKADINWTMVEDQLVQWSDLFRSGKTLRADIAFHYDQILQPSNASSSHRGGRRGATSATQRRRNDLANQLNAEKESTGEASKWAEAYRVMRCPDSCDLGPHCFRDPMGKKHYKLYPHHLRSLVDHLENGGKLESQADVPNDIRLQLYAEAQQRREQSHSKGAKPRAGATPITINNHFPDHAQLMSVPSARGESTVATNTSHCMPAVEPIEIPSPLDGAVQDYSEYQKARVESASYKAQIEKACNVVLKQGRDLKQIRRSRLYVPGGRTGQHWHS